MATILALGCLFGTHRAARAGDRPFVAGADVSMLTEIEKAGGTFRDDGKPADAITILAANGVNLFRLRLFVDPSKDFASSWGATQDLPTVRSLAERIKRRNALFLLDLHYSDTWADPSKQTKPKAWLGLDATALEAKVHDYTLSVLNDLKAAGATPDMVQVGNEITGGLLWPDGKVPDAPADQEAARWAQFARFFNAGARAVREFDAGAGRTRVVIHIHGGGRPGLPKWFFEKFSRNPADYDVVALSFYPAWGDDLEALKRNMRDVIGTWGKDVLVAETSYPWKDIPDLKDRTAMKWPASPGGQRQFIADLTDAIRSAPGGHGLGFAWWYPEAVPTGTLGIWRGGAEALFSDKGEVLPALRSFRDLVARGGSGGADAKRD